MAVGCCKSIEVIYRFKKKKKKKKVDCQWTAIMVTMGNAIGGDDDTFSEWQDIPLLGVYMRLCLPCFAPIVKMRMISLKKMDCSKSR